MTFDWWTFGLQAAHCLSLVWLLQRFLYRPVMAVIARRRAEAEESFEEAEHREDRTDELREKLEAERKADAEAREKMMADARAEIEAERKKALDAARAEAAEMIDAARAKIAEERDRALESLRAKAVDLAVDIAGRVLSETAAKPLGDVFLTRIGEHLSDVSAERRAELQNEIKRNGKLTVVTAVALEGGERDEWRKRISDALDSKPEIDFSVDKDLIAGAELHFRNAVLRFSWRDSIEQARRELKADADAE